MTTNNCLYQKFDEVVGTVTQIRDTDVKVTIDGADNVVAFVKGRFRKGDRLLLSVDWVRQKTDTILYCSLCSVLEYREYPLEREWEYSRECAEPEIAA